MLCHLPAAVSPALGTAKTPPAIREALEQRQWSLVSPQMELVAKTIEGYAAPLRSVIYGLRPLSLRRIYSAVAIPSED
jgi:hypothetical protein